MVIWLKREQENIRTELLGTIGNNFITSCIFTDFIYYVTLLTKPGTELPVYVGPVGAFGGNKIDNTKQS